MKGIAWGLLNLLALSFSWQMASAAFRLELGGGYSYSRLEYRSSTAAFTLLSDAGTFALGELGFGSQSFEVFFEGHYSADKYAAPPTRTLVTSEISRVDAAAGVRLMWENLSIAIKGLQKQSIFFDVQGASTYELQTEPITLGVGTIQFYVREKSMSILVELEAGSMIAAGEFNAAKAEAKRYFGASSKVNIGRVFGLSLVGGMRNYEYEAADSHSVFDFYGGLLFSMSFAGGKGGGSVPWNYTGPQWPVW